MTKLNKSNSRKVLKNMCNTIMKDILKGYDCVTEGGYEKLTNKEKEKKIIYKIQKNSILFRKNKFNNLGSSKGITVPYYGKLKDKENKFMGCYWTAKRWDGVFTLEDMKEIIKNDNHFCEVIGVNDKRKIYIDIEIYENEKKFLKTLGVLQKNLDKKLNNIEWVISNGSGYDYNKKTKKLEYKYSTHILIGNYYLTNLKETKKFKGYLESLNLEGVDLGVYDKNRLFKTVNQSKYLYSIDKKRGCETRIQKPETFKDDLSKHLVLNVDENCECADEYFKEYRDSMNIIEQNTRIRNKETKITMNLLDYTHIKPPKDIRKPRIINIYTMNKYDLFRCINPYNCNGNIYFYLTLWCIKENIEYGFYYKHLSSPWGHNQSFYNLYLEQWDYCKKKYGNNIGITRKHIKQILTLQYGEIKEQNRVDFINSFVDCDNVEGNFKIIEEEQQYINLEDFEELEQKFILFNLGLGYGKTFSNIMFIKKKYIGKCVLFLVNRITLKNDICGELKRAKIDFVDYSKSRGGVFINGKCKILVCTIESFHKFYDEKLIFDLIVWDEIESAYLTLLTDEGTIRKEEYSNTIKVLFNTIKKSKKCHFLDGLLMKRTYNLIKNLGYDENDIYTLVSRNKNRQKREILSYRGNNSKYRFFYDLIKNLKRGKRIFLYYAHKLGKTSSLNKTSIMKLKKLIMEQTDIKEEEICLHYSNSKDNKELDNVNEFWKTKKLIITTSSISVGVSYNPKDKKDFFHQVWIYTDNFVLNRDIIQTQARIRKPLDKKIRLCNLSSNFRGDGVSVPYMLSEFDNDRYFFYEEDKKEYERNKKIMKELYKDLKLEYNCKDETSLYSMFNLIGINVKKIIQGKEQDKIDFKELLDVFGDDKANCIYEYDNIGLIDYNTADKLQNEVNKGTIEEYDLIKLNKYYNDCLFREETDTDIKKHFYTSKIKYGMKKMFRNEFRLKQILNYDIDKLIKFKYNKNNDNDINELRGIFKIKQDLKQNEVDYLNKRIVFSYYSSYQELIKKTFEFYFGMKTCEIQNNEVILTEKFLNNASLFLKNTKLKFRKEHKLNQFFKKVLKPIRNRIYEREEQKHFNEIKNKLKFSKNVIDKPIKKKIEKKETYTYTKRTKEEEEKYQEERIKKNIEKLTEICKNQPKKEKITYKEFKKNKIKKPKLKERKIKKQPKEKLTYQMLCKK